MLTERRGEGQLGAVSPAQWQEDLPRSCADVVPSPPSYKANTAKPPGCGCRKKLDPRLKKGAVQMVGEKTERERLQKQKQVDPQDQRTTLAHHTVCRSLKESCLQDP